MRDSEPDGAIGLNKNQLSTWYFYRLWIRRGRSAVTIARSVPTNTNTVVLAVGQSGAGSGQ